MWSRNERVWVPYSKTDVEKYQNKHVNFYWTVANLKIPLLSNCGQFTPVNSRQCKRKSLCISSACNHNYNQPITTITENPYVNYINKFEITCEI